MMNSKQQFEESQITLLILQQIENITQEIRRTVSLLSQAVKILSSSTNDAKKLIEDVVNILTNDRDGIRNNLIHVLDIVKTYNIEQKKSLWSLRNSIIIVIIVAITNLITYLITH